MAPLHQDVPGGVVTTLAAVLIVGGAGPLQLAAHLTLTQSWFPRRDVFASLNLVSWSLSCEAFFYLCFPLILPACAGCARPACGRSPPRWSLAVARSTAPRSPRSTARSPVARVMFPPVRMAEFTLGIAVALLVQAGVVARPGPAVVFRLGGGRRRRRAVARRTRSTSTP